MLHRLHVNKLTWILNRTHIIIHSLAVSLFLYHRATQVLFSGSSNIIPSFLFLAELLLFLIWLMEQSFRWTPVTRSVFIENLPSELGGEGNYEARLPAVDVFICTADPEKEPTVAVMNTLISAMALDYPHDKLNVYLSDDGGAEVTLHAAREAWSFATWWVPFCREYGLKTRCPEVYFEEEETDINMMISDEFKKERMQVKEKYEVFKERVQINLMRKTKRKTTSSRDHPAIVEVINDNYTSMGWESFNFNPDKVSTMPLLVYVAREKRPSHPHHFKAGALNTLLRVSSLLSNSPIVLVLDCDMYCSDPTSIKQAICFHLDPDISPTLAFVQFPQRFHNLSKSDIYDSGIKIVFKVFWQGIDRLQGPVLSGTGFFIKRIALYDSYMKGLDKLVDLRSYFGSSSELIKTLRGQEHLTATRNPPLHLQEEARVVASCKYEDQTKWGDEVGFMYHSLVEDFFTGFTLHIKGWKSIYCDPPRAQFLGTTVNTLNETLTQWTRWSAGLAEVGLSRFCPLFYRLSSKLSLLQRLAYAWWGLFPLYFLPFWCIATILQLCLFHGIPIYPEVSSSFFPVIIFIILSSILKTMYEVFVTMEDSFSYWLSMWRMWVLRAITCHVYGSLDAIMNNLGLREGSFIPTNKVMDDELVKRYQQGVYDFQTSSMFLVPIGTMVILNMACFMGGVSRAIHRKNLDEMLVQVFLSGFGLVISWPVIEGMVVRKDNGRFPFLDFVKSGIVVMLLLLGSFFILS